jgi:hypothetical protein
MRYHAERGNDQYAECQAVPSRLILLPLRGRSLDKPCSYRIRAIDALIVPPHRVGMHGKTLRVQVDAERQIDAFGLPT